MTAPRAPWRKYWVFKPQLIDCSDEVLVDINDDERIVHVYLAADVEPVLEEVEKVLEACIERHQATGNTVWSVDSPAIKIAKDLLHRLRAR